MEYYDQSSLTTVLNINTKLRMEYIQMLEIVIDSNS